ncbi:MAG: ATP-binding cassette domain-containing protein [Gammaproteobacteria bacterium]
MLVGERLFQEYDSVQIIRDVTITVDEGGATVLLGKSGSGKSTLLRTLSLVDRPQSGRVSLDGKTFFPDETRMDQATTTQLWPDVTLVFQQFYLWPHVTLRQNILLPAQLRGKPVDRADHLCDALGVSDFLSRYPNQISVGQRQRTALARALLLQPKILLLDEITSAQDVQHVALILDVLRNAVSNGMGLLVVSHHLGFARQILSMSRTPRVVFLDAGSVIESGGIECLESPRSDGLQIYVNLSRSLA